MFTPEIAKAAGSNVRQKFGGSLAIVKTILLYVFFFPKELHVMNSHEIHRFLLMIFC